MALYQKYLQRHAEPEARALHGRSKIGFDRAFVLPIFDESISSLERFLDMGSRQHLLSVWVFNCPDQADTASVQRTQSAYAFFHTHCAARTINDDVAIAMLSDTHCLLLVNRCREGRFIARKQGVGLARKIGADIALAMSESRAEPFWVHFCDADVRIPDGYFDPLNERPDPTETAALYPFRHVSDRSLELASLLYDFKLHFYLEQLRRAGSPYAYHALGSIIAVSSLAYTQARGVPKRAGGEDFYLLNKLAKLGKFRRLEAPVLEVQARDSFRVPFGTGPAIANIVAMANPVQEYRYYHPKIFSALREVLALGASLDWSQTSASCLRQKLKERLALRSELLTLEPALAALHELGVDRLIGHCQKQRLTGARAARAFNEWFDAFVTLRFVHIMRDQAFASLPLQELAAQGATFSKQLENMQARILGFLE